MEKYVMQQSPPPEKPRRRRSPLWDRTTTEVNGKFSPGYCHGVSRLLLDSFAETGAFGHHYSIGAEHCPTHLVRIANATNQEAQLPLKREGISGLEFDNKGIYLASVSKSGCLTVHDFETLYCTIYGPSASTSEDETKQLLHLSTSQQLDVVRWNILNQDEVACSSRQNNKILIFDIGYISSEPVEVLEKGRSRFSLQGCNVYSGLPDIAFTKSDKFRLLASDSEGFIHMWDRRLGTLPCLELSTNSRSQVNSIQLDIEDRIVFGASKHGVIYVWDLRGGRMSFAFQCHNEAADSLRKGDIGMGLSYKNKGVFKKDEVHHPLLASMRMAAMLEKITSLKAQTNILSREIHSISFNPCCSYQLAFHLDDGWSGVLNTNDFTVTHMHCPPPAWLDGMDMVTSNFLDVRKSSWLPLGSIYAVASHSSNGIYLLDFYPDKRSGCHVDFNDDVTASSSENNEGTNSKFVPLSEPVLVCTARPLTGTIIAGTKAPLPVNQPQPVLDTC